MLALLLASAAFSADLQALALAEWGREAPAALVAAAPDDPDGHLALARALGRLRTAEALPALLVLKGDSDADVRLAVAEALGWTPDAAPAIREWLDAEPPDAPVKGRPRLPAVPGVRPALLASLGFHVDPTDVPRLRAALSEAPAAAAAAAISLGRFGRAKVPEAATAVPDLVVALNRFDPGVSEAAAFALFRIGLADASEADLQAMDDNWRKLPTGSTRAWALRALWPRLDAASRAERFAEGTKDKAIVVRIAALDAVEHGDVDPSVLGGLLDDRHSGVRSAALTALGRVGGDASIAILQGKLASDDPWEAAAVLTALAGLGVPPPDEAFAATSPEPVRAAAVGTLTDPVRLEAYALDDAQPAVRSAAIGGLLDPVATALSEDTPDPDRIRRLLAASDPIVREGAIALAQELHREDVLAGVVPEVAHGVPEGVSGDLAVATTIRGAVIHTEKGDVRIALYPEVAPLAVASFAALADRDFFVGVPFHRIVPGFVVQGGDPRGDGWGGPGYLLPDEVSALPYDAGALGMARSDRDTGGSQWFVTLTPQPHLVGEYTLFGHVTAGMPVVNALERGDRIQGVDIERVP